ncbi:MAG: hypothetical protein V2A74_00625, partial [bacterium]
MKSPFFDNLVAVAYIVSTVMYLFVTISYFIHFVREEELRWRCTRVQRILTIFFHILFLVLLGFKFGEFPLVSVSSFFSWVALALATVY